MTTRHVVALGGSLLRPEESRDREMWLGKLRQLAVHIEGNSRKLAIVVGGGLPAREGIELAKILVNDKDRLDEVGIANENDAQSDKLLDEDRNLLPRKCFRAALPRPCVAAKHCHALPRKRIQCRRLGPITITMGAR